MNDVRITMSIDKEGFQDGEHNLIRQGPNPDPNVIQILPKPDPNLTKNGPESNLCLPIPIWYYYTVWPIPK